VIRRQERSCDPVESSIKTWGSTPVRAVAWLVAWPGECDGGALAWSRTPPPWLLLALESVRRWFGSSRRDERVRRPILAREKRIGRRARLGSSWPARSRPGGGFQARRGPWRTAGASLARAPPSRSSAARATGPRGPPVTVADATVTDAGSPSGGRRAREKGCFTNPPTHPRRTSCFSLRFSGRNDRPQWTRGAPSWAEALPPTRSLRGAAADSRSLPAGAPRPDRHVPFLQGKDLLSLSPTGEEVSLQTVSFGDARVPGPFSRRLKGRRRH